MPTIIVLTEEALKPSDVTNITELHGDAPLSITVLVPADTEGSVVAEVIDHLSLFELRRAWDALTEQESEQEARQEAGEALATSIAALTRAGASVTGTVVADDPLSALTQAVTNTEVDEVIVVTRPHAVEDTFHTDWASRARETLGVPVLHFYTGSNWKG
ncbi:MAG: hypothetical protein ACK5H2_02495 [Beutenbergiaceae bacterium]